MAFDSTSPATSIWSTDSSVDDEGFWNRTTVLVGHICAQSQLAAYPSVASETAKSAVIFVTKLWKQVGEFYETAESPRRLRFQ